MPQAGVLHHVELYVSSLAASKRFWGGFLGELGYKKGAHWDSGATYEFGDTYITLVQAEAAYLEPAYHRRRVGLNHLAFHAASREQVDSVTKWVREHGYTVLYEDKHPLAGGADYYALFCEDPDRMKIELVAPFLD
jgi:catechol 2,3-dioxygenase-like lactoylglutathione lyase family enzyme